MTAHASPLIRRRATALSLVLVVCAMVGLAFAAVPLYRWICQATGWGGTTGVAAAAPGAVGERIMTVRFNANVERDLGWHFAPETGAVQVRIGEQTLALYTATNLTDRPITGTATYNVTPEKAGVYFSKIDCFCFEEQTLRPGEAAELPVSFFVDPAILDDPELDRVDTITLSYMFFEQEGAAVDGAADRATETIN